MPETYLLPAEAAFVLRVATKTLQQWRWQGKGPPYLKVAGGRIRYERAALDVWMAGQGVHTDRAPEPLPPTSHATVHALPPRRRGSRAQH